MKTAKECFYDAAVFATISQEYERRGLVANAGWFAAKAIYALAEGFKALVIEASDARLR